MRISFVGHAQISWQEKIKEAVKEQLRANAKRGTAVTCYLGGRGDFDAICARACKELKEESLEIEAVYVTPYLGISEQARIREMQSCGLCDSSLYPPIEGTPPKFAISKRNEWMVSNADLIIAYVAHDYGGAYQALQTARRRGKRIINLFDLEK